MEAAVINLADYRGHRTKARRAQSSQEHIYVCGKCGSHDWRVTIQLELRCGSCNTRAQNLEVRER